MVINHLLTGMILQVGTLHTEVSLDFLLLFFFGEILHRKKNPPDGRENPKKGEMTCAKEAIENKKMLSQQFVCKSTKSLVLQDHLRVFFGQVFRV